MKLLLLLIISASMLIESLVNAGDGYAKQRTDGCKVSCFMNNKFCDYSCRTYGAKSGICWIPEQACWCLDIPDENIWKSETNTCGGKT
uniref:Sodium channel toxin meuNa7 n=1 Tax=Mesobuthus eupeus TaxID=34648 RepID=A0A146CIR0_MESEU|nr:sodium channel toxin meuNa7 [Mesobuthus eupeus]